MSHGGGRGAASEDSPVGSALEAADLLLRRRRERLAAETRHLEQGRGPDRSLQCAEAAEEAAARLLDAALKRVRRLSPE